MAAEEKKPIDTLYDEYVVAVRDGDQEKTRHLFEGIYEEATHMAISRWGMRDRQYFSSKSKRPRLIHEKNWDELYELVCDCLRLYDPSHNIQFSTYVMGSINNRYKRSALHLDRKKRAGWQTEKAFPIDYDVTGGDAAEFSAADREIIELIKGKLRIVFSDNETDMKCYFARHVEGKEVEDIRKEFGEKSVTAQRVRQRLDRVNKKIAVLLKPIYNVYIEQDSGKISREDDMPLARCLQAALMEVAKDVSAEPVVAGALYA